MWYLPLPHRSVRSTEHGFETGTHMGECVMFVPNLGLSFTRVPDAEFWDAMDLYKTKLKPLKNKFAMELVTLTFLTGIPTAYHEGRGHTADWIPFSAVGQVWKQKIQEFDFWEEIPVHLVAELQESALNLAEQRGFCPDLVDFLN